MGLLKELQNLARQAVGAAEAGASIGTGALSSAVGMPYGIYKNLTSDKFGTQEGISLAEKEAADFIARNTYSPRTEEGQSLINALGRAVEDSKLAPIGDLSMMSGILGGVGKTPAKATAKDFQAYNRQLAVPGASYAYLENTPGKPNPLVGTRFEREYMGGLADKTPVKLEDYKGASVMLMPWDSTSRNYKITGISDVPLSNPVITHGGQDYARDLQHMKEGVAGASGLSIAKRIKDRDAQARIENIMAGGTGEVIHLPTTMGDWSENFSAMPIEAMFNFADRGVLSKADIKTFDESIRNFKVAKGTGEKRRIVQPFKGFKGIMTEEGRMQMYNGEGIDSTAGELRKAAIDRFYLKDIQKKLGFNAEDVSAAVNDEALAGVPKGYVGNTVIMTTPDGMHLRPSSNRTYNTNFTGEYQGTLGHSMPAEVLLADKMGLLSKEFAGKKGDIRNMVLGALEKRKEGVSQIIDDQMIERYYKYLADQRSKGLLEQIPY